MYESHVQERQNLKRDAGPLGEVDQPPELTACGYDLSYVAGEPDYLALADASGTRCELHVSDTGHVEWQCSPSLSGQTDAKRIADLATVLLTSQPGGFPRLDDGYARNGATLKGIVGRELAARGLSVSLEVHKDEVAYDVLADIVATNPAASGESRVWVSDSGVITWRSEYVDPTAASEVGNVARAIAQTIDRAMSYAPAPIDRRHCLNPWLRDRG